MNFKAFNRKIRVATDFSPPSGMKITGFFVVFILLFSSAAPFAYSVSSQAAEKPVLSLSPPKDPADPTCKGKVSISELSPQEYFDLINASENRLLDAFGNPEAQEQQDAGIGTDETPKQEQNQLIISN